MPAGAEQTKDYTAKLADFAASLEYDKLPADVVITIKKIILDSLGTTLAATTLGDGCAEAIEVMKRLGGPPEATILGTNTKISATGAAFANGALVHALNYDPIGATIGHLGVVCLAAPLAMAEARSGKTGRDLITASAVACEATARITEVITCIGIRPSENFLSGQLLTYFGAALGAGHILGLDAAGMRNALGLALMQMAGSRQIVMGGDPPAKAIYGAFPNQAGLQAALLSEAGLVADIEIFGKPSGLYPAMYDDKGEMAALIEGLGKKFVLTGVGFKPWPTSDQIHPAIEAAAEIAGNGLTYTDIAAVEITVHNSVKPWCAPLVDRRRPKNSAAAANSIPFCTAKALANGNVTLADFTEEGLRDTRALDVAGRTTYLLDDKITGARVAVTMADGTKHAAHKEQALGSSERPISTEHLTDKFHDCCKHASVPLPAAKVQALIQMVDTLEALEDISRLTALAGGEFPK